MLTLKNDHKLDIIQWNKKQFSEHKEPFEKALALNDFKDTGIDIMLSAYVRLLKEIESAVDFETASEFQLNRMQCVLYDYAALFIPLAYHYALPLSEENDWEKPFGE